MAPAGQQNYFPISELSTYTLQVKWTICARVTAKSQMRTFSNKTGGQGKVFSVDLLDAPGGEIRASFFNQVADQMYEKLQKGKCYSFTRGSIKVANRQYNNCNHRYELTFDKDAQVEEVADDQNIEEIKFSFCDLRSVQTKTLPCSVDLCGVITGSLPARSFTSKEGKDLILRKIIVADDTATSIEVTIFGERANQDDQVFSGNPIVCLKGVSIKEWNGGRGGSLSDSGAMVFGTQQPHAQKVQQWWAQGGSEQSVTALSSTEGGAGGGSKYAGSTMSLAAVRAAAEGVTDQPVVLNAVGRLAMVQMRKQGETQQLYYMACQEAKEGRGLPCNRRVDESGFCASCGRAGKVAPRMNLRCRFADFGDSLWLTTFHEAAQSAIRMTAEEVKSLEQSSEGGREKLEAAIREKYFHAPMQVTVRAKLDMYNGEPRSNITCIDARPVPLAKHARVMLKEIEEMLASQA